MTNRQLQRLKKKYLIEGYKTAKKKILKEGDETSRKFHPYDTEKAIKSIDELIISPLEEHLHTLQQRFIKDIRKYDGDEERQQRILGVWLWQLQQIVGLIDHQARINNII